VTVIDKPSAKKTIAFLEEEIRRLKELLRPPILFPPEWRLSRRETQLLAAIYGGADSPVSLARLIYAIYGDDEPEFVTDCVKVTIFHLRQKMRAHRVRIINVREVGWHLDGWSREFVRKTIEQK
jgi:DNA-binding response OmpR family regulator